jgi:hypothetical protein
MDKQQIMNVSVLHKKVLKLNLQVLNTETCTAESEWYKRIPNDAHWFTEAKKLV